MSSLETSHQAPLLHRVTRRQPESFNRVANVPSSILDCELHGTLVVGCAAIVGSNSAVFGLAGACVRNRFRGRDEVSFRVGDGALLFAVAIVDCRVASLDGCAAGAHISAFSNSSVASCSTSGLLISIPKFDCLIEALSRSFPAEAICELFYLIAERNQFRPDR